MKPPNLLPPQLPWPSRVTIEEKKRHIPLIESLGCTTIRGLSGLEIVEQVVHSERRSRAVGNHARQLLSVQLTHAMGIVSGPIFLKWIHRTRSMHAHCTEEYG